MSQSIDYQSDIEKQPISDFTEQAYLDYSMYVILDRALPSLADGLKPVQRRIIYAMSELGLKAQSKYKKSARTVGDVLGKFHPHGDAACYEAMVLMAQDFSYRYPFVDGQGNWGSPDDPKSFAAMRYTEAKLTAYSQALLSELQQGTVDWQLNFDGSLEEPILLPARLPNVLLNGASGIAVGMATDIPPHNLSEVVDACILLLDKPKSTLSDIMKVIQAPDYPTDAEIISSLEDIQSIYKTGHGSIRMRAIYELQEGCIVVNALPHHVSPAKILEQIAAQMLAKKLPGVVDLRDESDHEQAIRLVIVPRSNRIDIEQLMGHLFATTDLERSYRVNLNMIGLDGRPHVMGLMGILKEWLVFRQDSVTRRLQFRLEKVADRLHILDAMLIAFLNIDDVITLIRTEDHPKQILMKRYKLSDIQASAILDIRLRQLAKLEEIKIREEQEALSTERKELEQILSSTARLKTLIKKELKADKAAFGDDRRSQVVQGRLEAKAIREEDIIPAEPVTVVLSRKGFIRAAKGHEVDGRNLSYRSGDEFLMQAMGKNNQSAFLLDSAGKSYAIAAHGLPSARGQGEPLTSKLKPEAGCVFEAVLMGADDSKIVVGSDAGYGFITELKNVVTKNRAGKAFLKCPAGAKVLPPLWVVADKQQNLALISNEGRLLVFPLSELPELPKGKGNKMISVPPKRVESREEFCVAWALLGKKDALVVYSGKRHFKLKPADLAGFIGERGRRGAKLPRGFQRIDRVSVEVS